VNTTSLNKLKTADKRLITLAMAVDSVYPIQVICGHRNEADQNEACKNGKSEKKWPDSKHNKKPALAIDCVPDPDRNPATLDWNDDKAFEAMCLVFEQVADDLEIKIRLGRDFSFVDKPHIEILG
jgi:peptidoglycan LD-endopeptidase CwlK